MLGAQHRAGHTVTLTTPISKKSIKTAGILYVDDTNLWVGLNGDDDLYDVVHKAQESVSFWGNSLIATGGALNPEKCKWTIHDMVPKADGTWEYNRCTPALSTIKEGKVYPGTIEVEQDDNEPEDRELDNFQLKIPQASGRPAAVIDQLQSSQAEKNLGIYTPPDENSEPQFEAMRDRVDDWTTKMKAGCLPSRSAWLSYQCQLWSGLKYGIGTFPASL